MANDNVIAGRVEKPSSTLKDKLRAVKDWNKAAKTAADILAASSLRKEAQKMKLEAEVRRKAAEERKQRAEKLSRQAAELSKQAEELSRQAAEVSHESEDLNAEANALTEEAATLHEDADALSKEEIEVRNPAVPLNIERGAPDGAVTSGAAPVPEMSRNLPVEEAPSAATKSHSKLHHNSASSRQPHEKDTDMHDGFVEIDKVTKQKMDETESQAVRRPELSRDHDPFYPMPCTRQSERVQRYIAVPQRVLKTELSWPYWNTQTGFGRLTYRVKYGNVKTDVSFLSEFDLAFRYVTPHHAIPGLKNFILDLLMGKED